MNIVSMITDKWATTFNDTFIKYDSY